MSFLLYGRLIWFGCSVAGCGVGMLDSATDFVAEFGLVKCPAKVF